jgi:hypothetical protein
MLHPADMMKAHIKSSIVQTCVDRALSESDKNGASEQIVTALAKQAYLANAITDETIELLSKFHRGEVRIPANQSEADVLNAIAIIARNVIAFTRDIAGLRHGQPSNAADRIRGQIKSFRIVGPPEKRVEPSGVTLGSGGVARPSPELAKQA